MSEWNLIDDRMIDPEARLTGVRPLPDGSSISPYDVPDAFRVRREGHGIVVIEFRYATEEKLVFRQEGPRVRIGLGHNSRRLYRLEFDTNGLDTKGGGKFDVVITTQAAGAIDKLSHEVKLVRRFPNYGVAKGILDRGVVSDEVAHLLAY